MNGELSWTAQGRFGRKQRQRSFVQTSNLSLDGSRLELDGMYPFAEGTVVRLQLGIRYCEALILEVHHPQDSTNIRVTFLSPSRNFLSMVEERLAIDTQAREGEAGKWV